MMKFRRAGLRTVAAGCLTALIAGQAAVAGADPAPAGHDGPSADAGAAASRRPVDISNTSRGRTLKARAAERFYGQGMWASTDALTATEYPNGEVIVSGADAAVPVLLDDGTYEVGDAAPPVRLPAVTRGAVYSIGPWQVINAGAPGKVCHARFLSPSGLSYNDMCYQILRLANDGNGSHDFFISTMAAELGGFGHLGSYADWGMIQTRTTATGGYWQDWEPRLNHSGPCTSGYWEISVPVVGGLTFGEPWQQCQTMIATKSANGSAPQLRVEYSGGTMRTYMNLMMGYRAIQGSSSSLVYNWGAGGCIVFSPFCD